MKTVTITFTPYDDGLTSEDYDSIIEFLTQFGDGVDIDESDE